MDWVEKIRERRKMRRKKNVKRRGEKGSGSQQ